MYFFTKNREEIKGVTMLDYTFETQIANYEEDLSEANAKIQAQSAEIQAQSAEIQTQSAEIQALLSLAKEHGFDEQAMQILNETAALK